MASSKINCSIGIEELAKKIRYSIYEPEMFSGLYFRRIDNKSTITLFGTGKIVSTGANSEELAHKSIRESVFDLRKILNQNIFINEITTENIVAKLDINQRIDLEYLTSILPNSRYDLDEFPAVFYSLENHTTLLIFRTGKIVSVGSKNEYNAKRSLQLIACIIKEKL